MNIELGKVGMEYWDGYEVGDIRTAASTFKQILPFLRNSSQSGVIYKFLFFYFHIKI